MKKILTFLAVFVLLLSTSLVGCNLISRNGEAYFSRVVAKAGNVEVSFEEVYEMCNYVKYYNNLSSLTEEQVTKICQDILDKKLYLYHFSSDESVQLTEKEKNFIYSQVYEAINNTIYQYEQRSKWGAVLYQTRTTNEDPSRIYESYKSAVTYSFENGFVVNKNFEPLETLDEKPEFKFVSSETESVQSAGRTAYFNSLRETAKILGKTDLSNEALLQGEIDRIFASYCESALILKINYQYLKDDASAITAINNEIFDDLKELVESEKSTLDGKNVKNAQGETAGSIGSLKVSDVEALYAYCPSIVTENFFEVVHILLKSESESEEVKARLENIKAEINAKFVAINGCTNIAEVDSIIESLDIEHEFVGNKTEENLQEYKNFAKECVFNKYMYEYSEDSLTTTANYIIPVNSSLDTMVKEFANASRLLHSHEEGEGENKTTVKGEIFDMSDVVKSTYGYHLIMYMGEVTKIADENSILLDDSHEITDEEKAEIMQKLATNTLKIGHNKTTYNVLFENIIGNINVFEEKYNSDLEYEKNVIKENKLENKIYTDRMKDLWS